jgi:hypothetical protein
MDPMKEATADANAELLVAGVVRTLAEHALPEEPVLVARAVTEAVHALASGASVSEACRVGQLFIAAHPRDGARPAAGQAA